MNPDRIKEKIAEYKSKGLRLFTTSSFQTHSIPLIHILSEIDPAIEVFFINTGYHFPETITFKDQVAELLGIEVKNMNPTTPKYMQRNGQGMFLYSSDPDHCCALNKTQPVEQLLKQYDVWINGVRADQSAFRKAMKEEQATPHRAFRFHPMLDWTSKQIYEYRKKYHLPEHPLDAKGYQSIGCEPCTRRVDLELMEREARWYGMKKTECGLHTDLISDKS